MQGRPADSLPVRSTKDIFGNRLLGVDSDVGEEGFPAVYRQIVTDGDQ